MKLTLTLQKLNICDITIILYFTYKIWVAFLGVFVPGSLVNICAVSLMILLFILSVISYGINGLTDVFVVYFFVAMAFLLTYIFNSDVRSCFWADNWGISRMLKFSSGGIWAYLAVRIIRDSKKLLYDLKIISFITFIYYLILLFRMLPVGMWYIANNQGVYYYSQYNMGFGYSMIFVAIVYLYCWHEDKKKFDLIIALISTFCAFIWGSRGSLFCLLLAVFILFLINERNTGSTNRIIVFSVVVILCFIVYMFGETILAAISSFLSNFGLSSRSLESLLSGTFTEDAARTSIWTMVSEKIKDIFPFGLGAYGDRTVVMPYYAWGYSHNIFLEMTVSFGLLGIIFLVWLIYRAIKILVSDKQWMGPVMIMLCMSVKLMVSDSFWFYWAFWSLLALCVPKVVNTTRQGLSSGGDNG